MKILIIHPYFYQSRGAEKQVLNLANNLIKLGQEVSLLTFFSKKNFAIEGLMKNLQIITKPKLPYFKYIHMFYPPIILINSYKKILNQYDIINVHNFPATWAIKNSDKPIIWMCNEVPWVYPPSRKFKFFFNFIQKIYQKVDSSLIKKNVDEIVVLDKKRRQDVWDYYKIKAKIIPSGVDCSRYFPISKEIARKKIEKYSKKKLRKIVVLFVSNLSQKKGLNTFLRSIELSKKREDITSLIVGDGPEEYLIKEYSKKINIIHLKGVPEELMLFVYNSSDIFIFPAINQPWGLVPFEAMACKIPTLVSKEAGASEVLKNLKNTILIKPHNPLEISKKLDLLLKNKKLYSKISNEGYKFVKNKLTNEEYAKKMLKLFKKIKIGSVCSS